MPLVGALKRQKKGERLLVVWKSQKLVPVWISLPPVCICSEAAAPPTSGRTRRGHETRREAPEDGATAPTRDPRRFPVAVGGVDA